MQINKYLNNGCVDESLAWDSQTKQDGLKAAKKKCKHVNENFIAKCLKRYLDEGHCPLEEMRSDLTSAWGTARQASSWGRLAAAAMHHEP